MSKFQIGDRVIVNEQSGSFEGLTGTVNKIVKNIIEIDVDKNCVDKYRAYTEKIPFRLYDYKFDLLKINPVNSKLFKWLAKTSDVRK